MVFVPLSGLVSVNYNDLMSKEGFFYSVFVPLSGLVSVNWIGFAKIWEVEFKFSSPYRG